MRKLLAVVCLCGLMLAMTIPVLSFAQGTDPAWLDELKVQIEQDENCDSNYFLDVQEYSLGGTKVYEARVQCVDGRQFDAKRTGRNAPFVISACQPVVC